MVEINFRSKKPIYEQIIDELKKQILCGRIRTGDRLPSIRRFAVMIEVNPNTVAKAYNELERQKLIETIQGKGTFVTKTSLIKKDDDKLIEVKEQLKTSIIELRYLGLQEEELKDIVISMYNDFN